MGIYSENRFRNLSEPIQESLEKDKDDKEEIIKTLEALNYSKQEDLLDS